MPVSTFKISQIYLLKLKLEKEIFVDSEYWHKTAHLCFCPHHIMLLQFVFVQAVYQINSTADFLKMHEIRDNYFELTTDLDFTGIEVFPQ